MLPLSVPISIFISYCDQFIKFRKKKLKSLIISLGYDSLLLIIGPPNIEKHIFAERRVTEKILVIGYKKAMNDICIGCIRCTVAFNRKDGEFALYKGDDAHFLES